MLVGKTPNKKYVELLWAEKYHKYENGAEGFVYVP